MEASEIMLQHLVVDFYNTAASSAKTMSRIIELLQEVNREFFAESGSINIKPVLSWGTAPQNSSITGMLNAAMGHFVIHVFSQHDVAFVDFFSTRIPKADAHTPLIQLIRSELGYRYFKVNSSSDLEGSFEQHCTLQLRALSSDATLNISPDTSHSAML